MSHRNYSPSLIVYTLILLLTAFFSILALGNARRFHPDEAFYVTIGRNAAVNGDWWLSSETLDKPPLTYYSNAFALVFIAIETDSDGVLQLDALKGEFAGRISSLLCSILLVALVMKLAKTLTKNQKIAYLSGILMALSPLRIVFAATAFTDMPMLCLAVFSLLMAIRGKAAWAGFFFILSFAAKPQVIFYLPLILIFLFSKNGGRFRISPKQIMAFLMPIFFGGSLLLLWDAARIVQGAMSIWALGQARYTPTELTPVIDYPARIFEIWGTLQFTFGHGFITAILLGLSLVFFLIKPKTKQIMLLWLWVIAFIAIHVILTLNLFDRNLILVLPVLAIIISDLVCRVRYLIGTGLSNTPKLQKSIKVPSPSASLRAQWGGGFRGGVKLPTYQNKKPTLEKSQTLPYQYFFSASLCLTISVFSFSAAQGNLPIGGDNGRHDGINELADYLNEKPVASVIYDTWLDWELDYYMGQWTNKRRVFYPSPELLIEDALALAETGNRYFIVPIWEDESAWLAALTRAGFSIVLDKEFENFRVWQLRPPN